MRTYLITCNATAPARHRIAGAIMQLSDAWARPLDATWYVQSSMRPGAIREQLGGQLDPDAGLLIQEVEAGAVLLNATLTWFKRRKPQAAAAEATNVVAFPAPAAPQARAA
jgi:hypothetical protein